MSDLKFGELITGTQYRDAVHVAVAPVMASERLYPGERIAFIDANTELVGASPSPIGIVDPYLTRPVQENERFWMFLMPNTVTGMRHQWQHPAFQDSPVATVATDVAASIAWLNTAADRLGVSYADLISSHGDLVTGDYINNGEDIRDEWYSLQEEFWKHRKIVTGVDVRDEDKGVFTCSC